MNTKNILFNVMACCRIPSGIVKSMVLTALTSMSTTLRI